MKNNSTLLPAPLIEMIRFCDEKGFDVQPVSEGTGEERRIRFIIWKDNAIMKIGKQKYKTLVDGQREVYAKLYNALT